MPALYPTSPQAVAALASRIDSKDFSAGPRRPPARAAQGASSPEVDPQRSAASSASLKKGPVSSEKLGITLEAATTDDLNAQIREEFKNVIVLAFEYVDQDWRDTFEDFFTVRNDPNGFRAFFEDLINDETDEILEAQVQRAGACVCMHWLMFYNVDLTPPLFGSGHRTVCSG